MKRILVIEDGEKHREDARAFFKGLDGEVEVTYATSYNAGSKEITSTIEGRIQYDGAIVDIYMPQSTFTPESEASLVARVKSMEERGDVKGAEHFRSILETERVKSNELIPGGVGLAMLAGKASLPFVICTAGYHHGARYEWISALSRTLGWGEIVDGCKDYLGESDNKDWKGAYEALIEKMK